MAAVEETGPGNRRDRPAVGADPITQATSVAVVAAALLVWWPAFDLGAYGAIFFNQFLSLWAASTAIFLVSLTAGRRARVSWPRRLALLLPSLWLLLAFVLPEAGSEALSRALFFLAIVLTLAGIPFLAALVLRVTISGYEQIPARRRLVAAGLVAIVAIASFGLGKFNNRFLTCNDFIVSGNDTPNGCAQGHSHLGSQ
jgi:hypothetical protein